MEIAKLFEENNVIIAVINEIIKKLRGSAYAENYAMFYSDVAERFRASKGMAIYVDKKMGKKG